jgi:hypothetical protein
MDVPPAGEPVLLLTISKLRTFESICMVLVNSLKVPPRARE